MPILKKLLEFQKLNITISKDTKNDFYNSKYATLNQVLDKVRKPLNDKNILILQQPEAEGLKTRLIDLDDDSEVSCFMPYTEETKTAQKLGSNNTYNRRYSLVTLLGLEDEDDDGNVASVTKPASRPATDEEMGDVMKDHGNGGPCDVCGKLKTSWKEGVSKTGKPYAFYACETWHK